MHKNIQVENGDNFAIILLINFVAFVCLMFLVYLVYVLILKYMVQSDSSLIFTNCNVETA